MIDVGSKASRLSILFAFGIFGATTNIARADPPSPEAGDFPIVESEFTQPAIPPPSDTPGDCGQPDEVVPDIDLVDLNPNSSTYTTTYTLGTFRSEVVVIYWALAS